MKRVLHGNLSCLADFGPLADRFNLFMSVGRPPIKSLLESTLLFDQIVIPTNDFMPLAILIACLGERSVRKMLDDDVLKFVRFKGSISYAGGGVGIAKFDLYKSDGKTPKHFSLSSEEAIRVIVDGIEVKHKPSLIQLAHRATEEFKLENASHEFANTVYKETGQNLSILSHGLHADLRKLPGVTDTDVRGLSGVWKTGQDDDVFQVLRVAQGCMEAIAARTTNCDDVHTADQVAALYKNGLNRAIERLNPDLGFASLREIADIPDIPEAVLRDQTLFQEIWKLRGSNSGVSFRAWFHENCVKDPASTAKEYVALLKEVPRVGSPLAKTLRFVATSTVAIAALPAAPLVGLAAGVTAGAIDSFLIDRIGRGANPKIFIDRLADIAKI